MARATLWVMTGLAVAALLAAGGAQAGSLSQRHAAMPVAMPLEQCLQRGREVLLAQSLRALAAPPAQAGEAQAAAPAAAVAETTDGAYLVSIYCLPEVRMVVISAAGPSARRAEMLCAGVAAGWGGNGSPPPSPLGGGAPASGAASPPVREVGTPINGGAGGGSTEGPLPGKPGTRPAEADASPPPAARSEPAAGGKDLASSRSGK